MKSIRVLLLCACIAIAVMPRLLPAAGRIIAAHDDLVFADGGFHEPSDPGIFARNVAAWFTGGRAGRFLAYSDNQGLTGASLINAMTSAGHAWVVSTSSPLSLSNLMGFDGVFLCGHPVATDVLVSYVNAGGNVYVAGLGVAEDDMAKWNPFLQQFGLGFTNQGTGVGDMPTTSPHSIFNGVDHLYGVNGSAIVDLQPANPINRVLVHNGGSGLFGVWGLERSQLVIRVSQVEVCWQTETNRSYRLEYRSSFTTNSWVPLGSHCHLGDGSIKCVYDAVPTGEPQRFYRVTELIQPSVPTGLRVVSPSKGSFVTFAWEANTTNERIAGYQLVYGPNPDFFTEFVVAGGDQTSVSVVDLTPGETVHFALIAFNECGVESSPSATMAYTVPNP